MMKKILAILLAAMMLLSVVACGNNNTPDTPDEPNTPDDGGNEPANPETPADPEQPENPENPEQPEDPEQPVGPTTDYAIGTPDANGNLIPTPAENTTGAILWNFFYENAATPASPDMLGNNMMMQPYIPFMGGAMPIMPDPEMFYDGFGEYQIEGYEMGAKFMPMMGSIAFVGYIFDLAEGADVKAFVDMLVNNCNPRWMVCVEADQIVAGSVGNRVFFLMCPKDMITSTNMVITPEVEEGSTGMNMFNSFLEIVEAGNAATTTEIAAAMNLDGFTATEVTLSENEGEEVQLEGLAYQLTIWDANAITQLVNADESVSVYIIELPAGVSAMNWLPYYATPDMETTKTVASGAYNSFAIITVY